MSSDMISWEKVGKPSVIVTASQIIPQNRLLYSIILLHECVIYGSLIITYHLCNMRSFCPKCCRRCKRIWGEILMVIETAALIPKVCIDLVGNSSGYESVKAENTAWSGRWNQKMNFVLRLARSSYFVLVAWTLYDFGSESGESSLNIGSFAIMEIFECMWLQPSIFCILEKIEKRGTT